MPRFCMWMLCYWFIAVCLFGCVSTPRISPELAQCRERPNRFTRYENGAVLDTCTQLMWMAQDYRNIEGAAPPRWLRALDWADKMNQQRYGGYSDWRAATLKEYAVIYNPNQTRRSYKGQPIGYPDPSQMTGANGIGWRRSPNMVPAISIRPTSSALHLGNGAHDGWIA